LPIKWKGLPKTGKNAVKFGRHIPPSYTQRMVTMPPNLQPQTSMSMSGMMGGMGDNSMLMPPSNLSLGQLPNGPSSVASTSTTNMNNSKPTGGQKTMKTKTEAKLCGKCPKCKIYLPPSQGPSMMVFPTQSRKMNVRNMHSMGVQDAKNFRATQYYPQHRRGLPQE
jgi:hypothetical protein